MRLARERKISLASVCGAYWNVGVGCESTEGNASGPVVVILTLSL